MCYASTEKDTQNIPTSFYNYLRDAQKHATGTQASERPRISTALPVSEVFAARPPRHLRPFVSAALASFLRRAPQAPVALLAEALGRALEVRGQWWGSAPGS